MHERMITAKIGIQHPGQVGLGWLRRAEVRLIAGYTAYLRTRFARVVSRPLILLIFGLLAFAKAAQLIAFVQAADAREVETYTVAAYYALTLAFLVVAVALFAVRRKAQRSVQSVLGGVVALAGTFLPSWLIFDPERSVSSGLAPLASVCLIGGMAFAVWSLATLGRCVSIMPEVRGLVRSGPYALVRHPLYLGEMIATLGVLLPILSPRNVAIFVAFCALQVWRTYYEEQILAAAFPEYADYRQQTARLLPKLY